MADNIFQWMKFHDAEVALAVVVIALALVLVTAFSSQD